MEKKHIDWCQILFFVDLVPPSNLLDSIRKGIPLRNVNVDKLKEEQKKFRADAKNKLASMKSLEETLKDALTERMLDMNLYEEEDEEDETWD